MSADDSRRNSNPDYDADVTIRVLLFGVLAEELGKREVVLTLPNSARLSDANPALAAEFPSRAALLRTARLSLNAQFAAPTSPLREGDELAVIELVGGG